MKNALIAKQASNVRGMKIDIGSIHIQMANALTKRAKLQKEQEDLWLTIKKHHCDRSTQMSKIVNSIGSTTHQLNQLISQLCQYKKTHKAMNLAYNYINNEINRINKIVNYQINSIKDVNMGRYCLIDSYGVSHTNTRSLENYVSLKKEQVKKLENWKNHVKKYMV